jgi:NadR type nicotinamide-nucleotide adenylyltransferase
MDRLGTGGAGAMMRVCLTGVESSGKSMLAPRLAARFGGLVVPEYGRTYAETHGTDFTAADLHRIAEGHIATRRAAEQGRPPLIVEDTDIVLTAAWAEMLFGAADPALEAIRATADLYLLFSPDVPWIADGTRLFGTAERRARFHALIVAGLDRRGILPLLIEGDWEQRYESAVAAVAARIGVGDGQAVPPV